MKLYNPCLGFAQNGQRSYRTKIFPLLVGHILILIFILATGLGLAEISVYNAQNPKRSKQRRPWRTQGTFPKNENAVIEKRLYFRGVREYKIISQIELSIKSWFPIGFFLEILKICSKHSKNSQSICKSVCYLVEKL